jgi:hypothetical protein
MIALGDIPEMLAAWRSGELLFDEVYGLCLDLFAAHRVEEVFALLPPELRDQFGSSLVDEFDNNTPAERYVFLDSGTGDSPNKVRIINEARAYLARVAARDSTADDTARPRQLRVATAITYSIGSEFAPDDPFGGGRTCRKWSLELLAPLSRHGVRMGANLLAGALHRPSLRSRTDVVPHAPAALISTWTGAGEDLGCAFWRDGRHRHIAC